MFTMIIVLFIVIKYTVHWYSIIYSYDFFLSYFAFNFIEIKYE